MAGTAELVESYQELRQVRPEYEQAEQVYDGDVPEVFASEQVKWLLSKANADEVEDFNYAKIPVDVVAAKLRIASVTATLTDQQTNEQHHNPDDPKLKHAQDLIRRIQKRCQFGAEYPGLFHNVCKLGDGYLFVWPVQDEQGKIVDVDVFVNSPDTVRAFYETENPLQMSHVIKAWAVDIPPSDDPLGRPEKRIRANLYYPDRIERYITKPGVDGKRLDDWELYEPDNPETDADLDSSTDEDPGQLVGGSEIPNPHGQIPFFHFRNDRPYGTPRHKSAYGPQALIGKLVQTHAASIDYLSFPQRYALMDPKQDDPLSNYVDPINPEDDDDDPEGDYNSSQLRSDPAAVWRLRGMKQVGQFETADVDSFLRPFDRYVKAMSELCGIPLYKFGTSFAQPPTGAALREIDKPTNEEARNLQGQLGSVMADAFEFALRLLGVSDVQVEVRWEPVYTVSDLEGWNIVGAKIANGVPVRQALVETGYTAEQVDQWLPDQAEQDLIRQVQMLNQIGTAVQSLGAGVGLGVISQEAAAAAIERVLALGERQGGVPEEKLPKLPPEHYGAIGGKSDLLEPKDPNQAPPEPPGPPGQGPPGQPAGAQRGRQQNGQRGRQ